MATLLLSSIILLRLCIVHDFDLTSLAFPELQCHSNDKGWDYLHLRKCRRSISHTTRKANSANTTLLNTQRQPGSPFLFSCNGDLNSQGECREKRGRCWSPSPLVPPSLWAASIVCASSNLSQAACDPPETWTNLCAIWEMTQRHLAFAQKPCALWKFIVFSCDTRTEAHKEGSCSNLGWRKVRPIFWPFWQSNKIKSNLHLSEVHLQQNL